MRHTLEKHKTDWSKEEDFYLKLNFKNSKDIHLARKLNRTLQAIVCRRHHLGLKRKRAKTYTIIKEGMYERYKMIALNNKVEEMKYLIQLCQVEENNYRLEKYKAKLRKLSGL